ncbi:MAG TPA: MFS transporter [Solirubrobacteraceae bacterium]|nr:MFS transporter [Solirubrobacteraceae bacterium]
MKPVLRIPVFRRLLAAYTLNELAYWVGTVALTLLIYGRTGSALGATAFFLCAAFVPALISPMLVARLDQLPPRPVLSTIYWLEAVIFLALAALAGRHFMLVTVLALTLVNGILALTGRSLARAATVAVTSAAGLLREGNALGNAGFSLAFLIGPALGGAVVAAGGATQALLGDAALFAAVGLVLATARGLPQPSPVRTPARGRVLAAVAYVRERPPLRGLMLLQASGILFFTISVPVEVVFAQHSLHAGPAGYGAMVSAWGAGAVAGAAVYARWNRLPSRALIALGAGALGIGLLVMALAPTLAAAIVGAAVAGVGNGIESVAGRTAVQELTEASWMALMMSLQESLYQTVPGAGILLGGTITALGSPRTALAVAGAGSLVITLLVWVMLTDLAPPVAAEAQAAAVPLAADPAPPPGHEPRDPLGSDPAHSAPRLEQARASAVRHQ